MCETRTTNTTHSGVYRFTDLTVMKRGALSLNSSAFTTEDSLVVYADTLEVQMESSVHVDRSAHLSTRLFEVEKTAVFVGDGAGFYSEEGMWPYYGSRQCVLLCQVVYIKE